MGQRFALIAAWFAATAVAVVIASAAVGAVRGEVTDQPQSAEPFLPAPAPVDTTTTTTQTTTTTDTTSSSTSSTTTTSTSSPDDGTTTTTRPQGSTTTTTSAPSPSTTTTTTQPNAPTQLPPYQLVGGTVTIAVSEPNVWLVGAVPSVGFAAAVEYTGPEKVEVEFESADKESKFRAKWEDGKLIVDIDEE